MGSNNFKLGLTHSNRKAWKLIRQKAGQRPEEMRHPPVKPNQVRLISTCSMLQRHPRTNRSRAKYKKNGGNLDALIRRKITLNSVLRTSQRRLRVSNWEQLQVMTTFSRSFLSTLGHELKAGSHDFHTYLGYKEIA